MHRNSRHSRFASVMALSLMAACSITAAGNATADNPEGASAPLAPVWYVTAEKSLVGNQLHEAGVKVQYAGLPSDNLIPTCDEGERRRAEYKASNDKRVAAMVANHSESKVGDPTAFMAEFQKALSEERATHQAQIAALVEMNQSAALQLAQASTSMAELAKMIATQQATPASPAVEATAAADAKDAGAEGTTPAKRTRG